MLRPDRRLAVVEPRPNPIRLLPAPAMTAVAVAESVLHAISAASPGAWHCCSSARDGDARGVPSKRIAVAAAAKLFWGNTASWAAQQGSARGRRMRFTWVL